MAMTVDAVTKVFDSTDDSETTLNHTPSGTPTFATVGLHTLDQLGHLKATSVTYGGQSMTLAEDQTFEFNRYAAIWYIASPPSGAQDIVVSWDDSSARKTVGVITYIGGGVAALTKTNTGSFSTSSSLSIGSVNDAIIFDCICISGTTGTLTVGSGQTIRYQDTAAIPDFGGSTKAGAASVSMSWGWDTSASFVHVAFSIPEAAAGLADFSTTLPGEGEGPTGFGGKPPSFNPFPLSSLEFSDYAFFKTTLDLQNKLKRIRII